MKFCKDCKYFNHKEHSLLTKFFHPGLSEEEPTCSHPASIGEVFNVVTGEKTTLMYSCGHMRFAECAEGKLFEAKP